MAPPGTKVGSFTHTPTVDLTQLATPACLRSAYTAVNVVYDQEVGLRSPAVSVVVN